MKKKDERSSGKYKRLEHTTLSINFNVNGYSAVVDANRGAREVQVVEST